MTAIIKSRYRMFWVILMLCYGCVEPYEIQTDTFEDVLVVDALLTDKLMYQEINLSRTFPLEAGVPVVERNANVSIIDDMSFEYAFSEVEHGKYVSDVEFGALPEREYTLLITTSSGKKYSSTQEKLVEENAVDFNIDAQGIVNSNGIEGVAVYYENSELGNEDSSYFRFEYVETYKINSPYWYHEYLVEDPDNGSLSLVPKENENGKVCYNSAESSEIILRNISEYSNNNIEPFMIKFNEQENPKIQSRYSLLVKQYSISREAYTFYKTLKDFSESESLLSETQPGTVIGNLYSVGNLNETVIGFFEIAKSVERRIFFNYADFYDDVTPFFLRPYFYSCELIAPSIQPNGLQELSLMEMIETGLVKVFAENFGEGGPYQVVVPPECGDCSVYAEIEEPDFWEE